MNNTQLYLSIGIPSLLVVLAWLSNKSDMSALRSEVKGEISGLRAEIRSDMIALRAEMIGLRKEIYEALIPLHERMAVIETKQK